jgi:hypothetical protein
MNINTKQGVTNNRKMIPYCTQDKIQKIDGKPLYKGLEKIKLDINICKRVERNWTHYDVEVLHNNWPVILDNSKSYGVYSPPYPAHRNDEKMDKEIDVNELCKRVFIHDKMKNKFYFCYGVETEVEIGYIKLEK